MKKRLGFLCFSILLLFLSLSLHAFKAHKPHHLKILILGNSITYHAADTKLGWNGNWGMAASSQLNDYVHLLIEKLKYYDTTIDVRSENIATIYERKYWKFDTADFVKYKEYNPDIIIVRLGENVPVDSLKEFSLENSLGNLIKYIEGANKHTKVLITTTFWENNFVDQEISSVAKKKHWKLISLSRLSKDRKTMALGKFNNEGVSRHPSDFGMKRIYEKIWESLKGYIQ